MIELKKIQQKMDISFDICNLAYLKDFVPGVVQSIDIPFTIDGFDSETAVSVIYNEDQIIEYTKQHNFLCHEHDFEELPNNKVIIAEDVGGSPIILDLITGSVLLFWFDFDGKLALLFDNLEMFYNSLIFE